MKTCIKCKIPKPFEEYSLSKGTYKSYCKLCVKNYNKLRNSLEEIKIISKQYYIDNKKSINIRQKEYDFLNKDKKREHNNLYYSDYFMKKYHSDPNFRLRRILSVRFRDVLKKNRINKNNSIIDILGCTMEEFKLYIESLFLPEMNWGNHGCVRELDHILPCSSFNLTIEDEKCKCFNYSNYQPLFKTTEISKSFGYINQIGNRDKSNKIF